MASISTGYLRFQLRSVKRNDYLNHKFGSVDAVQEMTDRLTEVGKTVGIDFDFGDNWLAGNTLQLHQLLNRRWKREGIGNEMKEKFLSAYFEETQLTLTR